MTRLLLIAALAVSCSPFGAATPASGQRYPTYQYVLVVPTRPVSPNERLTLTWEPKLAAQPSSTLFELQLCVALFGPWDSVEALKKGAPQDTKSWKSCPAAGAIATSQTLRTASASGARLAAEITVPFAPGFYNLREITVYDAGDSTSTGSVIEVR
ncbi:MAG TPA: hypothetical protein VEL79_10175 [Vicinamibacterales bacterium]|nr:hypothetical protein [Vicinamibacterales bacterium]